MNEPHQYDFGSAVYLALPATLAFIPARVRFATVRFLPARGAEPRTVFSLRCFNNFHSIERDHDDVLPALCRYGKWDWITEDNTSVFDKVKEHFINKLRTL